MSSMIVFPPPRTVAVVAVLLVTAGCTLLNDLGSYPGAPVNDASPGQDEPETSPVVTDAPDGGGEDSSSDRAAEQVDAEDTDAAAETASRDSVETPNTANDGGIDLAPSADTPGIPEAPEDGGTEAETSPDRPGMVTAPDGAATDIADSNETGSTSATVITFEDLFVEPDFWDPERTTSGMRLVPGSYAGLQWNSAACVINKESKAARGGAYGWGTIGAMSLFTRNGTDLSFSGPAFDFTGAYVTAHAENPVALTVQAFRGSTVVNSATVMITPWPNPDTNVPYFYTFNFLNVDSVTFVTGGNQWFVIDNLTIERATGTR
jgi:hypothetical protein